MKKLILSFVVSMTCLQAKADIDFSQMVDVNSDSFNHDISGTVDGVDAILGINEVRVIFKYSNGIDTQYTALRFTGKDAAIGVGFSSMIGKQVLVSVPEKSIRTILTK
ncbi:MAG: hypothetical protein COT74_11585 [Bdellovibrionales bacterium CG10_big_fil_rev_8_21_14_0_10_45_34]|nr:MAG: hypothetical protein COT74_11585 [Bdellovibrionales bacterium CG10_big_fil_rev_8_21_14_0_10_45_34]